MMFDMQILLNAWKISIIFWIDEIGKGGHLQVPQEAQQGTALPLLGDEDRVRAQSPAQQRNQEEVPGIWVLTQDWKSKFDELVISTLKECQEIDERNFDFKEFIVAMTDELGSDQEFLVPRLRLRNFCAMSTAPSRPSRTSSGSTSSRTPPSTKPRPDCLSSHTLNLPMAGAYWFNVIIFDNNCVHIHPFPAKMSSPYSLANHTILPLLYRIICPSSGICTFWLISRLPAQRPGHPVAPPSQPLDRTKPRNRQCAAQLSLRPHRQH